MNKSCQEYSGIGEIADSDNPSEIAGVVTLINPRKQ